MEKDKATYKLPKGWVWTTLNSVSKIVTDGKHKTPNYNEKGIPFPLGCMQIRRIRFSMLFQH